MAELPITSAATTADSPTRRSSTLSCVTRVRGDARRRAPRVARRLGGRHRRVGERCRHGGSAAGRDDDRRHRLPRHAGADQRPPPPVPEPHPRLPADDRQAAVRLVAVALSVVAAIDTESVYVSAWVGLAELALSGCTTSTDHLYLHPHGAGDLLTAEIEAARDLGVRFHPTRGSMSLSREGRRPAARRRRRRRRRDPRRQRGGGRPPPRPVTWGDDPHRARPVLTVHRDRGR